MSCYQIYYKDGAKYCRPIRSEAEYRAIRSSGQQTQNVQAARGGDKNAKCHLVQFCYSCIPGPDGRLKGCTTASNSVGMDIDLPDSPPALHLREGAPSETSFGQQMQQVKEKILDMQAELGLLMLERSATKGFHLVFIRRPELSQEDNLRWASKLLGVPFDEAAKDITRVFFTTTASPDDLLFLSPELFTNKAGEQIALLKEESASSKSSDQCAKSTIPKREGTGANLSYHGIPLKDIVDEYWNQYNEGKLPCEGDRNAKTFELALTLRSIVGYSQQRLEQVIPRYDGFPEDEWRETIRNALKEPRRGISHRLTQVLNALKTKSMCRITGGTALKPPPLPDKLPPLLKLLTSKVPDIYKPAVCEAVFPALGAHFHETTFRYADNVEHEPTFMSVLMAPMSSGKGSINKPIDYIMADIRERDNQNRQRDQEWKDNNSRKGANKGKDPRPTGLYVQYLMSDLTNAALTQRLLDVQNNGHRFLYVRMDEMELLTQIKSTGKGDPVGQFIRLAYDNSLYGQERVGCDSVTGVANVRFNFNASTTPERGCKFMKDWVSDGTLSRLSLSTIIPPDDRREMPVMGIYDERFAEELRPYIDRINAASGLIQCPKALALARQLCKENYENASYIYQSEAYNLLSYRANVIAYLKGMVLYVAHGYRWSKEIEDYVRWSEQYDLWCKMRYFGEKLETDILEEKRFNTKGPLNLLAIMPQFFSYDEYLSIRLSLGLKGDGRSALNIWQTRGYLYYDEVTGVYGQITKT